MHGKSREAILRELNALDPGPTEDERRTERGAVLGRAIETEGALKWGRAQAGALWGIPGSAFRGSK